MNPLAAQALGSIVRAILLLGAGYLVKAGIWTATDTESYVTAASVALIALGWSVWQKHKATLYYEAAKFLGPHSTDADVKELVNADK